MYAQAYPDPLHRADDRRRSAFGNAGIRPRPTHDAKSKAPVGSKWLHEIKYDGYRLQIHLNKGAKIYTRNGHDWTNRFPIIADAFDIPVEKAIFDGEVVVVHEGPTNFSELQADLASRKQRRMVFYAFDLLFLEGFDLRKSPQIEHKRVLKMLFDETKLQSPILYSEHMLTDGNEIFAASCKLGLRVSFPRMPRRHTVRTAMKAG